MLRGSLEEFALSDIFRLIAGARKTGRLEISRRASSGGVYFRDGEIYFAESSLTREPLGQKLVRAGVLSERDLMKALDEHASSGMRVGEVLVRNGAIDKSQLALAIRSQVQDAASDCLKWEVGEFEFESSSEVVAEIPIRVTVDYVIMEASRLIDDVAGTERKIRSRKMILRRVADLGEAKQVLRLSTGEERMFLLVDGERQVSEIIADADGDELTVLRTLHGLLSSGMLEVVPTAAREAEPLVYVVDPVRTAEMVSAAVEETGFSSAGAPQGSQPVPAEASGSSPEPVRDPEPGVVLVDAAPAAEVDLGVALIIPLAEAVEPDVEVEIVSAASEAAWAVVTITEDDPAPINSAEAEISSIAATPAAPPAPRVEVPEPVKDWFADPELQEDAVMPPGADDAPITVTEETFAPPEEAFAAPAEIETPRHKVASSPQEHAVVEPVRAHPPQPPTVEAMEARAELSRASAPPSSLRIDRAVVVRELASLFSEDDTPSAPAAKIPGDSGHVPSGDAPRGLEDDDDLDRGLIHRLIDGVKGL